MKAEYDVIIENYESPLNRQHSPSDATAFFRLLFDENDYIQIKQKKSDHPADAEYIEGLLLADALSEHCGQHSDSGIQFCSNPIPPVFVARVDEIWKLEAVCKPQWDRIIPFMRDGLTLSSNLFECGRTFFIEADDLPSGEPIISIEDKKLVLAELLSSDLPISYVLDTGGRGPHIGLVFQEPIGKAEFDNVVAAVMERLPSWIDNGVGRVNQLERMPNTTRLNKMGHIATVKSVYCGGRIGMADMMEWIASHPVVNHEVRTRRARPQNVEWDQDRNVEDTEGAAWTFVSENGLKSSTQIRNGKIQVSCPNTENHRHGDKNMSAFINVESGLVWCAACHVTVGRTFRSRVRSRNGSPLFPWCNESTNPPVPRPKKLF